MPKSSGVGSAHQTTNYHPTNVLYSDFRSAREDLQDKENATYLGAAMDELIRRRPSLKEATIQGVMQRIEELWSPSHPNRQGGKLRPSGDAK